VDALLLITVVVIVLYPELEPPDGAVPIHKEMSEMSLNMEDYFELIKKITSPNLTRP
jgi:hypothetical protein